MRGKVLKRGVLFKFTMYSLVARPGDTWQFMGGVLGYDTRCILQIVRISGKSEGGEAAGLSETFVCNYNTARSHKPKRRNVKSYYFPLMSLRQISPHPTFLAVSKLLSVHKHVLCCNMCFTKHV